MKKTPTPKIDFAGFLIRCEDVVRNMGIVISYTHNLDAFFKGDLDGRNIYIGNNLGPEEKLFNLLHLAGHTVQWNIDELLRSLGSELYRNPSDQLLQKLQTYEWDANCYALGILHEAGITTMDGWLHQKYLIDMFYLTHFYKTGKKLKRITEVAKKYQFNRDLVPKVPPPFTPKAASKSRNGIVINFDEAQS